MKALLPKLATYLLLFLFAENVTAQEDSIVTDVFTLSTCNPISVVKKQTRASKRPFRLEINSRTASSFRITGINPLRYKYYINNEAVTQFMDPTVIKLSINPFTDGNIITSAPEIKIPEIFKTDSLFSKTKQTIRDYQTKNKFYADSITLLTSQLDDIWFNIRAKEKDSNKWNALYSTNQDAKKIENRLTKNRTLRERSLKEYQMYISGLPLNNPTFGILELYKGLDTTKYMDMVELNRIRKYKKEFAIGYCDDIRRFKNINQILFDLESDGHYEAKKPENQALLVKKLLDSIRYYNLTWSEDNLSSNYYGRMNSDKIVENIRDIKEQILNKQFQIWEEFTLNMASRIGVFVQSQFMEFSSFNNALENFTCLDLNMLDSIKRQRNKLDTTFKFIQQTNSELQTLVPYLDLNTDLYQSIAKKINANYLYLLSYLKNLDYASKSNSIQYTLPTHSNLSNIDLLRYTVKREDKITKNTQTYNYDFWLKGGLKVDFSFVFFGTRLTDNVYNKVLLDTSGGIDRIRITKQDNGFASFSFGGMVNVIPRNGAKWLNLGGSIGIAYSDNKTLQALTSLSLHLGKMERIIIHGGFAFGTVKYLDISANDFTFYDRDMKQYPREKLDDVKEKDRVYMLQSKDIKYSSFTIPLTNKFVARPFVGISYNLSRKSALRAISNTGSQAFDTNFNNASIQ